MIEEYKKVLYSNTFCAYRDKHHNRYICRHKYGYGICDLDLCPIVNESFSNIIFQEDGVYLIIKTPSEKYVAGEWQKIKLEIKSLDDFDNVQQEVTKHLEDIPEHLRNATLKKLKHIFERWEFLLQRNKAVGILSPTVEEHIEATPSEAPEETTSIEEELEKELEKIEE